MFVNDPSAWIRNVTPFLITDASQFRSHGPFPLASRRYAADFAEVKPAGSATSTTCTADQTNAAGYSIRRPPALISLACCPHARARGCRWPTAPLLRDAVPDPGRHIHHPPGRQGAMACRGDRSLRSARLRIDGYPKTQADPGRAASDPDSALPRASSGPRPQRLHRAQAATDLRGGKTRAKATPTTRKKSELHQTLRRARGDRQRASPPGIHFRHAY